MTSGQETLVYIEEKDKNSASSQAKIFAKDSVKNRAYINTLGVGLALKYLASEGVDISNLHNIHSVHKFLEEFDIADITLPNARVDVRVVFDEKYLFVPKSHFEYGLTPDIYLFLLLASDSSHVKFLGFVEPRLVNKNNANAEYYFVEKEKLSAAINLKEYLSKATANTCQNIGEDLVGTSEAYFISMVDNDLSDNHKKQLIANLLKSDELRDRVIEYSTFEIFSTKAMSDEAFRGLLSTEVVADVLGVSDVSNESNDTLPSEELTVGSESEVENFAEFTEEMVLHENLGDIPTTDEFDLFNNSEVDDFEEFNQASGELSVDSWDAAASLTAENLVSDLNTRESEIVIVEEPAEELESLDYGDLEVLADDEGSDEIIFSDDDLHEEHPVLPVVDENPLREYASIKDDAPHDGSLISFDDIDVSVDESVTSYHDEEAAANHAVSFDVLTPMMDNIEPEQELGEIVDLSMDDGLSTLEELPVEGSPVGGLEPLELGGLESLDSPEYMAEGADSLTPIEDFGVEPMAVDDIQGFGDIQPMDDIGGLEPIGELQDLSSNLESNEFDGSGLEMMDSSVSFEENISVGDEISTIAPMEDFSTDGLETIGGTDELVDLSDSVDGLQDISGGLEDFSTPVESVELESIDENLDSGLTFIGGEDSQPEEMSFEDISSDMPELEPISDMETVGLDDLSGSGDLEMISPVEDIVDEVPQIENIETMSDVSEEPMLMEDISSVEGLSDVEFEPVEDLGSVGDLDMVGDVEEVQGVDELESVEAVEEIGFVSNIQEDAINALYPQGDAPNYDDDDEVEVMDDIQEVSSEIEEVPVVEEVLEVQDSAEDAVEEILDEPVYVSSEMPEVGEDLVDETPHDEINPETLLADFDNILGTNDTPVEGVAAEVTYDEQQHEEEQPMVGGAFFANAMQNSEKGKKGMTAALVLVAAFVGIFAVSVFTKSSKDKDLSSIPADAEIIDKLSNEGFESEAAALSPNLEEVSVKTPKSLEEVKQTQAKAKTQSKTKQVADVSYDPNVQGTIYPEIKKISFEIPDYLTYSEGIKKYLQTVGRSVKLSATSDLLLTSEYSASDRVKVVLTLSPDGIIKSSKIEISSGSQQIDQIVLQSVKNTLNVVKPPAGEVKGEEFNLALIINF